MVRLNAISRLAASVFVLGLMFQSQAKANDGARFFETKIRPILTERCLHCHGHQQAKGGLRLDNPQSFSEGGQSGPLWNPQKIDASLLLQRLKGRPANKGRMPKEGDPLTAKEIEAIESWLRDGAPWPDYGQPIKPLKNADSFSDEDREYWAFQGIKRPSLPSVDQVSWVRNEIDLFVLARLEALGLTPNPEAKSEKLLRRIHQNLHGLPPNPADQQAFTRDRSPKAYERLVDRLLTHSNYGEHWARFWLDVVRYAESDGYRGDFYRPTAWPYRDYVIDSFNADKPYDVFVSEQIAGDELAPNEVSARIATGFLRHGIYEWNQRDVRGQWAIMLNDVTETTADAFLGLGYACAKCHDHKFDPILQEDYYRLQAYFTPLLPRDDLPLANTEEWQSYQAAQRRWETATESIRTRIDDIERPIIEKGLSEIRSKFEPEFLELMDRPRANRSPLEHQIAELAYRQLAYDINRSRNSLKGTAKERRDALLKELELYDSLKPTEPGKAFCATDVGPSAPPTHIPDDREQRDIAPGPPSILDPRAARVDFVPSAPNSTGRRSALARWLTNPSNPLVARVYVNRLWQQHFGVGLVATTSDFGRLGEKPSHPALLDWLANEFIVNGWSTKHIQKLILNSATFRQSANAYSRKRAMSRDPKNRLLWRFPTRRLKAEQVRDAMLAASNELDPAIGGPSVDAKTPRRTVYTKQIRNRRDPLLDAFDLPYYFKSESERNETTTATQALLMLNGEWVLKRAEAFAKDLLALESTGTDERIDLSFQRSYGRQASHAELSAAKTFLAEQAERAGGSPFQQAQLAAWTDYCHALLNSNEFLYVD